MAAGLQIRVVRELILRALVAVDGVVGVALELASIHLRHFLLVY